MLDASQFQRDLRVLGCIRYQVHFTSLRKDSLDEGQRTGRTSLLGNGHMEAVVAWVSIGRLHKPVLFRDEEEKFMSVEYFRTCQLCSRWLMTR